MSSAYLARQVLGDDPLVHHLVGGLLLSQVQVGEASGPVQYLLPGEGHLRRPVQVVHSGHCLGRLPGEAEELTVLLEMPEHACDGQVAQLSETMPSNLNRGCVVTHRRRRRSRAAGAVGTPSMCRPLRALSCPSPSRCRPRSNICGSGDRSQTRKKKKVDSKSLPTCIRSPSSL